MHNRQQPSPKTSWVTLALLCVAVAFVLLFGQREALVDIYHSFQKEEPLPQGVSYASFKNTSTNQNSNANTPTSSNQQTNSASTLPSEFLLDVPFTTQAPFSDWGEPYQEACEEASVITVHYYYEGKTFTQTLADQEILAFVDFENKMRGDYKDTTAQETADLIKQYWKYNRVDVIDNPSLDDIKRHVSAGRPVIVPAAGKLLGNPNFRNGGPLYHNFVIKGYDETDFITNDVGTRKGNGYRYTFETVMNAMHDWNGGDVTHGAKRIIVVYPNS